MQKPKKILLLDTNQAIYAQACWPAVLGHSYRECTEKAYQVDSISPDTSKLKPVTCSKRVFRLV